MWHLIFETRLPIGLGARSLRWDHERLPNASDFLQLVSLDSGSYWFTIKVDGAEGGPLDFVPLIMLLDKHQNLLSTCTIKVGHRNPLITATEHMAHSNETADFVNGLQTRKETGGSGSTNDAVKAEGEGSKSDDSEAVRAKDPQVDQVKVEEGPDAVTASGSGNKASLPSILPFCWPVDHTASSSSAPTSKIAPTPTPAKPVAYGKYIFGGRSALEQSSPSSAHKQAPGAFMPEVDLDTDSDRESGGDSGEGWVDAVNSQDVSSVVADDGEEDGSTVTKDDVDDLLARVTRLMSGPDDKEGKPSASPSSSTAQPPKPMPAPSGVKPKVAPEHVLQDPAHMRDLITCSLPLLPRPAEARRPESTDTSDAEATFNKRDKGKGKATARARTSFGLSLEDRFISVDNTRESTPVLDQSTTSVPASAATLSPSTRSRVASSYFADLCNNRQNTAATNGVLDIIQTEGVDLDSTLGLKLLELAQDLSSGGKYSTDSPYTRIWHRDDKDTKGSSWSAMMQRHEQSARLLEKVLDRLNDHSGMLNVIAEASGVNLLDADSDGDANDENETKNTVKTPTQPRAAPGPHTPTPATAAAEAQALASIPKSPQAALQSLLAKAQSLPGATATSIPPINDNHATQLSVPGPYMAICPPHPSAYIRPADQMRPLPATSPIAAPSSLLPRPITAEMPAGLNALVWSKVQAFAKSSAEARAKAEKEQQEALQAHILDMYNLSKAPRAVAGAPNKTPQTVLAPTASASAGPSRAADNDRPTERAAPKTPTTTTQTSRLATSPIGHLGLNTNIQETDPATQADFDYQRYQHWSLPPSAPDAPGMFAYRTRPAVPASSAQIAALNRAQQQQMQYNQQSPRAMPPNGITAQAAAHAQAIAQYQAAAYMQMRPAQHPHQYPSHSTHPPGAIAAAAFHARMQQHAAERAAAQAASPPGATDAAPYTYMQARPPAGPAPAPSAEPKP